jgi:DNA-binding PadR family transcriptional regulator
MNKTTYLGELEHMVLLAILRLGDDAYGISIRDELEARVGREVTRGAAYITLERLTKKGYLATRMGEPSPERGGRAKRFYEVTALGREALRESGQAFMRLWAGQEALLEDT